MRSGLAYCRLPMDKISSTRVRDLCARIQEEKDPQRFLNLIQELNRILGENDPAPCDPPNPLPNSPKDKNE